MSRSAPQIRPAGTSDVGLESFCKDSDSDSDAKDSDLDSDSNPEDSDSDLVDSTTSLYVGRPIPGAAKSSA